MRFVGEHAKDHADKPFFLYVAYTAAHWPMHALPEDIAKYKGKYDARLRADPQGPLREGREARPDRPEAGSSARRPATGTRWRTRRGRPRCMEVYAAMIDRMDQGIGQIVAELKRTGQLDNTLILFLQDNGGCAEPMGRDRQQGPPEHRAARQADAARR